MIRKLPAPLLAALALTLASAQELRAQGVTISTDAVTVNEGATGSFNVHLSAMPAGPVSVGVNNTIGLATVTASPNPLLFDATNWNIDQVVTVSSPMDGDTVDNGATLVLSIGSNDLAKIYITSVDTMPAPVPDHPMTRISLPRNGDVVMGDRAEFFGSPNTAGGATPVQGQFFIDGVLIYTDPYNPAVGHFHVGGGHSAWNTTVLSEGPHVLRLTVTDNAGRTGTHEVTVIVDNQPSGSPSGGGSGSSGGGGGCGLTGLEAFVLFPLISAFRRRNWKA
jgi:hypothetical protein